MKIQKYLFILFSFFPISKLSAYYIYESSCEYAITSSDIYSNKPILKIFKCPDFVNNKKEMINIVGVESKITSSSESLLEQYFFIKNSYITEDLSANKNFSIHISYQ